MRSILLLSAAAFGISACSGGSSGANNADVSVTTVEAFDNGSGAGRYEITIGDETVTGIVVTPALAETLAEIRGVDDFIQLDLRDIETITRGQNTRVGETSVNIGGTLFDVLVVRTNDGDAVASLLRASDGELAILASEGIQTTDIPRSGGATYSGTLIMEAPSFADEFAPYDGTPEIGEFTATVDFASAHVAFDGMTKTFGARGRAKISDGKFGSHNLKLTAKVGEIPFTLAGGGNLQGNFHGKNANSIAGVIYSDAEYIDLRGSFAGSR